MNCPNCKKDIDNNSVFCNFCAFKIIEQPQQFYLGTDVLINPPKKEKSKVFIIVLVLSILTALIIAGIAILATPHIIREVQYQVAVSEVSKKNYKNAHNIFIEIKKKNATYRDLETLDLFVQAMIAYTISNSEDDGYKIPLELIKDIEDTYTGEFRASIDEMKMILEKEKIYFQQEENRIKEEEEKKRGLHFFLDVNLCPLKITNSHLSYDNEGVAQMSVTAENTTDKTVDAFIVEFYCYDNFNRRANYNNDDTNVFPGMAQAKIEPKGMYIREDLVWTAYDYENATKFFAFITEVHFIDNTTWKVADDFDVRAQKMADECIKDNIFNKN